MPTPKPPSVCMQDSEVRLNCGGAALGSDSVTVRAVVSVRLNIVLAAVMPFAGVSENGARLLPAVV